MICSFCRRLRRGQWSSEGWKAVGGTFLCQRCRRRRYKLRSFTSLILEIDAAAWEHLRPTLQDARSHLIPRDELWEAKMTDGQPVVRILIGPRWCELRLNNASWSSKKRAAYESVASDAAGAELFLFRQSADARRQDSSGRQGDAHTIVCRIEALLLRSQVEASQEPQAPPPVRASKLDLTVSQLEKMNVRDLRKAIRANLVSFPAGSGISKTRTARSSTIQQDGPTLLCVGLALLRHSRALSIV